MLSTETLRAQASHARRTSAQARDDLRRAKERLALHALSIERSRASLIVRVDVTFGTPRAAKPTGPPPRAVQNLSRLRRSIERTSGLGYFANPRLRQHADRLVADAALVGAHPFTEVLAAMVAVGGALDDELPGEGILLDLLDELSAELLTIERSHRSLSSYLSDFEASGS